MELLSIFTGLLTPGDDLVAALAAGADWRDGDIAIVSSKAVATVENAFIDLSALTVSDEARRWSQALHHAKPNPAFRQAVLNETERLHGTVLEGCPSAMLTELRPDGLQHGTLLVPNAGLDLSNAPEGWAIGWPTDPATSTRLLKERLEAETGVRLGVVLSDSGCRPRRIGVTAIALTVSGFDPLISNVGREDLFGRSLRMTQEALADQLATAGNMLMGNAAAATPAAIVRDLEIPFSDYTGWVDGIEPEEDLFRGAL